MISIKKIMSVIAIAFAVMTIAGSGVYANAQVIDPCTGNNSAGCKGPFEKLFNITTDANNPSKGVVGLIAQVGTFLVGIIAAISVVFLILGAFDMVSDAGDGKKFATGKSRITNAIIGLVVALLAFAIISLVINFVQGGTPAAPKP
jgi:Type IV secretion system pilin